MSHLQDAITVELAIKHILLACQTNVIMVVLKGRHNN